MSEVGVTEPTRSLCGPSEVEVPETSPVRKTDLVKGGLLAYRMKFLHEFTVEKFLRKALKGQIVRL